MIDLKQLRKEKKITQEEAAMLCGMSLRSYKMYENEYKDLRTSFRDLQLKYDAAVIDKSDRNASGQFSSVVPGEKKEDMVFILKMNGISDSDIAAVMCISEGSVKIYASNAKKRAEKAVKEAGDREVDVVNDAYGIHKTVKAVHVKDGVYRDAYGTWTAYEKKKTA